MRKDGVRLKDTDPMYTVVPHIMVDRNDAMNMIELNIPVTPMNRYIREKKKEGVSISHLGLFIAAYVRTVAEFPSFNRFIVNRKIYARKGIQVSMVVLKADSDEETMNKMHFMPEDDIFEVTRKLNEYVNKSREHEDVNATDAIIKTLVGIPGLLRGGVAILKWMDKHGLLPMSIIEASPFHASMTITNLASIGTNHIFHHIYNFGTDGQVMALGNLRNFPKRVEDGKLISERCIPVGLVMDERLCSGLYYAKAFRKFQAYLKDPSLLEGPPEVCIREWELQGKKKK